MSLFRVVAICLVVFCLGSCRKKTEATNDEINEAGYAMTTEGWFDATRANDVAVMKKMVAAGFDEKTSDSEGNNGLHIAAETGNTDAAEYFLNRGLSVDAKNSAGATPLMAAVLADQTDMVKWLLRQGANPTIKDNEGFIALMLAVSNGREGSVEELAPYNREDLDDALLVAALVGQAGVIDTLTNYGASVYAQMPDGRTALMVAAENGHAKAVEMLMDIGASRFATLGNGDSAQSLALAAGHTDIATMIETGFVTESVALQSDEQVADAMEEYLEENLPEIEEMPETTDEGLVPTEIAENNGSVPAETVQNTGEAPTEISGQETLATNTSQPGTANPVPQVIASDSEVATGTPRTFPPATRTLRERPPVSLSDATVSRPVVPKALPASSDPTAPPRAAYTAESADELPLVMRAYRQQELPVELRKVSGNIASLRLAGMNSQEIQVSEGEKIPNSELKIVKVYTRREEGKLNTGQPVDVGVVVVEDATSGQRREWISGRPATGHDPVALVEDAATGQHYIAKPGQRFYSEDGREFIVNDLRPSQLVIEEVATGEVRTLPLRGSKG